MGCDSDTTVTEGPGSGDGLDLCTNDAITTGACKVEAAGVAVTDNTADIVAGNIRDGVTIFGVSGDYSGSFMTSMASTMHRDKAEAQMTLEDEAVTGAGTAYPNDPTGYRAVPDIGVDDDGYTGGSVTYVDRTGWGSTTCGTAQATIEDRIADCASEFGAEATWDGSTKANSGQGAWKLVSRTGDVTSSKGREVWRDERTGLLWSSLVSTSLNWCKASGSNNITNNPTAQPDPDNYCDNATYQNTGTGPGDKAVSACFEDGDNFFTTTDGDIDNAGKAGLNLSSTPVVAWRLPNIYDLKQADVNGMRFVLPDTGGWEWSASVGSVVRNGAWYFVSNVGNVNGVNRFNPLRVRCVGR